MALIYVYAELLLNIRQVTVFATLPSNCNEGTHFDVGSDRKTLHVQHEDEEATIELPCHIVRDPALNIPLTPTKELSFRLGVDVAVGLPSLAKSETDRQAPWPASKLTAETELACQSCGNLLVKDLTDWKDLPSGGWADMMDFWHCHKPSLEISNGISAGSTKGYAASNDLGPTSGVGVVDVGHFLVAKGDCIGLQVRQIVSQRFGRSSSALPRFAFCLVHGQQEGGLLPLPWSHSRFADTIAQDLYQAIPSHSAYLTLAEIAHADGFVRP